MARKISRKGLALIKSFESYVGYVYDDLLAPIHGRYREWDGGKVKGTLTIGYGHTDSAKHPLKIVKGLKLTEPKAVEVLDADLDECEAAVNDLVTVKITQGQFDALVSFAFNCGIGNLKKLIVPLNRGDYDGCRAKFDEFTRSKGQVLKGLQRRRDAEQALFDDRADELALPVAPVMHTAEVDGPAPPASLVTSKIQQGTIAGGGLSVAGILATVWDNLKDAPESLINALVAAASKPSFWFIAAAGGGFGYIAWRRYRLREREGI